MNTAGEISLDPHTIIQFVSNAEYINLVDWINLRATCTDLFAKSTHYIARWMRITREQILIQYDETLSPANMVAYLGLLFRLDLSIINEIGFVSDDVRPAHMADTITGPIQLLSDKSAFVGCINGEKRYNKAIRIGQKINNIVLTGSTRTWFDGEILYVSPQVSREFTIHTTPKGAYNYKWIASNSSLRPLSEITHNMINRQREMTTKYGLALKIDESVQQCLDSTDPIKCVTDEDKITSNSVRNGIIRDIVNNWDAQTH